MTIASSIGRYRWKQTCDIDFIVGLELYYCVEQQVAACFANVGKARGKAAVAGIVGVVHPKLQFWPGSGT